MTGVCSTATHSRKGVVALVYDFASRPYLHLRDRPFVDGVSACASPVSISRGVGPVPGGVLGLDPSLPAHGFAV